MRNERAAEPQQLELLSPSADPPVPGEDRSVAVEPDGEDDHYAYGSGHQEQDGCADPVHQGLSPGVVPELGLPLSIGMGYRHTGALLHPPRSRCRAVVAGPTR